MSASAARNCDHRRSASLKRWACAILKIILDNLGFLSYGAAVPAHEGRIREASQCGAGIGACGRGFTRALGSGGRRPIREADNSRLHRLSSARPTLR